jgi:hypothetical protein
MGRFKPSRMTSWAYDRLWADVQFEIHDRVFERMSSAAYCKVEDAFSNLYIPAFQIIHVISPPVSVFGRGSQPESKD